MSTRKLKEDVFSYLTDREKDTPLFPRSQMTRYEHVWKRGRWHKNLLNLFGYKRSHQIKYVFVGTKFKDLIVGLPRDQVLVYGGNSDFLFCLKNGIYFNHHFDILSSVIKAYTNDSNGCEVQKCIEKLTHSLKKIGAQYLVVSNDSLPLERIFIRSSRSAGLASACIQHGLFQSSNIHTVNDGYFADYMLVFDRHHLNLLVSKGVAENKIKILGYHSNIFTSDFSVHANGHSKKICIISQPWPGNDEKQGARFGELMDLIVLLLTESGLTYSIKPHPAEKNAPYLSKYNNLYQKDMATCLKDFDVFISFTSTALLEASLAHKVAIQILDKAFNADNFQNIGYAYTIGSKDLTKLPGLINTLPPNIDDKLCKMISPDVTTRFLASISK